MDKYKFEILRLHNIQIEPISTDSFHSYGDVIETGSIPPVIINQGKCKRYSDLADLSHNDRGRIGISLFQAELRSLPYELSLMERHPLGPQCFFPIDGNPFLVIVAAFENNAPDKPRAFITNRYQGINFRQNTWHGVLTPLHGSGLFAVIDWLGSENNLIEYKFDEPYIIGTN